MEFLFDFNFQIIYTAGKNNQKTDILSRRKQDLETQESAKKNSRLRVLLGPDRLDPWINAELAKVFVEKTIQYILASILAPLSLVEDTELGLIRDLQIDNQKSFQDIREEIPLGYSVKDSLLLYYSRLCVRHNTLLCTRLIREVHD